MDNVRKLVIFAVLLALLLLFKEDVFSTYWDTSESVKRLKISFEYPYFEILWPRGGAPLEFKPLDSSKTLYSATIYTISDVHTKQLAVSSDFEMRNYSVSVIDLASIDTSNSTANISVEIDEQILDEALSRFEKNSKLRFLYKIDIVLDSATVKQFADRIITLKVASDSTYVTVIVSNTPLTPAGGGSGGDGDNNSNSTDTNNTSNSSDNTSNTTDVNSTAFDVLNETVVNPDSSSELAGVIKYLYLDNELVVQGVWDRVVDRADTFITYSLNKQSFAEKYFFITEEINAYEVIYARDTVSDTLLETVSATIDEQGNKYFLFRAGSSDRYLLVKTDRYNRLLVKRAFDVGYTYDSVELLTTDSSVFVVFEDNTRKVFLFVEFDKNSLTKVNEKLMRSYVTYQALTVAETNSDVYVIYSTDSDIVVLSYNYYSDSFAERIRIPAPAQITSIRQIYNSTANLSFIVTTSDSKLYRYDIDFYIDVAGSRADIVANIEEKEVATLIDVFNNEFIAIDKLNNYYLRIVDEQAVEDSFISFRIDSKQVNKATALSDRIQLSREYAVVPLLFDYNQLSLVDSENWTLVSSRPQRFEEADYLYRVTQSGTVVIHTFISNSFSNSITTVNDAQYLVKAVPLP